MIEEHELRALARDPAGTVPYRPVDAVVGRGDQLRRRRRALWFTGAAAVTGVVMVAAVLVVDRPDNDPERDLETAQEPSTTDGPTTTVAARQPESCPEVTGGTGPTPLPPSEVPNDLRRIPTSLPAGVEITATKAERWEPPAAVQLCLPPADYALVLRAMGGDDTIDAGIVLEGPVSPSPVSEGEGVAQSPTTLRGAQATLLDPTSLDDLTFIWTEPDGWSWELSGFGPAANESTVRAVAEALELDSAPESDEPLARLPVDAVPAGFGVTWQALGAPVAPDPVEITWRVTVGSSDDFTATQPYCEVEFRTRTASAPVHAALSQVGSQLLEVGGRDAVRGVNGAFGDYLSWDVAPGVSGTVSCTNFDDTNPPSAEIEQQLAESVVAVEADDPRLRPD